MDMSEKEEQSGYLAIHYAVSSDRDQPEILELLLRADKNNLMLTTADPNGEIALHGAVRHGHFKQAELLIAKGSNVNAVNKIGQTPLSAAVIKGYTNIALLLIKNGARLEGTTPVATSINQSLSLLTKKINESGIQECSKLKELNGLFEEIKCHYFFALTQIVNIDENKELPVHEDVLKDYISRPNSTNISSEKQQTFREEFVIKMQALLKDAKFVNGSKEYNYINQLKEAVSSGGTKNAYNLVHPIIKSLSNDIRSSSLSSFKDYMGPIKDQIIELMKKYNKAMEDEKLNEQVTLSILKNR